MRNSVLGLAGTILAASFTACSSDGPSRLPDSSAAGILQEAWKEESRSLLLGPIQFRRGLDTGHGYVPSVVYPMYRAVADKGLITLENERDLSGGFSGWNDFFALTQAGVQRTATVVLTPEGAKIGLHRDVGTANERVRFVFGSFRIERVVSNEALDINGDKYRVVQGTKAFYPNSEFIDVMEASGQDTSRERRFRALLKFDVFDSQWKLQIADVGSGDGVLSEKVPTALAKLRLAGTR